MLVVNLMEQPDVRAMMEELYKQYIQRTILPRPFWKDDSGGPRQVHFVLPSMHVRVIKRKTVSWDEFDAHGLSPIEHHDVKDIFIERIAVAGPDDADINAEAKQMILDKMVEMAKKQIDALTRRLVEEPPTLLPYMAKPNVWPWS